MRRIAIARLVWRLHQEFIVRTYRFWGEHWEKLIFRSLIAPLLRSKQRHLLNELRANWREVERQIHLFHDHYSDQPNIEKIGVIHRRWQQAEQRYVRTLEQCCQLGIPSWQTDLFSI